MSSRANLSSIEEQMSKLIHYAASAHKDLPHITLSKNHFNIYKKYNRPDYNGEYYYKNIMIKSGNY